MSWRDEPWHDWMVVRDGEDDRVDMVNQWREAIDEFPKTKQTFSFRDVYADRRDRPDVNRYGHLAWTDEVVSLVGSWRVPSIYRTGAGGAKFVNPDHPHAIMLTEGYVMCECGTPVVRVRNTKPNIPIQGANNHDDDCLRSWRLRARAELCEKRKRIIEECLLLGHNIKTVEDRLGTRDRSWGDFNRSMGIDTETLKYEGLARIGRTAARLCREYSPATIGRVYDRSSNQIRRLIKEYTDASPTELFEHRRASA